MSRTKEMLESYDEYRHRVNQRRTGGIVETADRSTPVITKKKNTDGLINNSQTYCYWTARGLQILKEEYGKDCCKRFSDKREMVREKVFLSRSAFHFYCGTLFLFSSLRVPYGLG